MASTNSLRCLRRPRISIAPRIQPFLAVTVPFTTSTALDAKTPALAKGQPKPQKKSYKKGGAAVSVKKPQPGERKAFRKRIQLSNNSALPVTSSQTLEADTLSNPENAGKVVALPDALVDQLRALEAFKHTQSWGLFRRPHVLVRDETLRLMKKLKESAEKKEGLKAVITGSKLSGKSTMLLQAMSYALQNDWVAIHLPEAFELTNGQTDYSPVPETEPMQFYQPAYCLALLQNILKANRKVLTNLRMEKDWTRLPTVTQGGTLADLVSSCREGEYAWPTLSALWTELTMPGRPPVLFTLDGLSHINKMSEYRDPSYKPIHAHDLTLIGMFVAALSGKTSLPNGGAVIAATSGNNTIHPPSQELALAQLEAGQAGKEIPEPNPYERKYENRVYDALKNSYVLRVEGVTKEEGRSLMEYWGASGLAKGVIDTRTVAEKWALGGHGLVGEMERATLMTMRL
ncbi:hypothetical protein S7711_02230 [Stachybotrys chartarum IBT 7711]|uniref:Small ribosomal subunit protein mS29 n=1 Tax=Stachybotrys chartarum (strain CBS 109288 / IBT 7711) TaxID=1280523 RepID=A0A084AZ97_STACB|nr:hypothetical protein S7711_02230 [Stachybotrys chartarum IBT 7711]KFA53084.1 hypothetical protein S40293_05333 [Stachybotrys chartarum IBT 40293]KFA78373.1 hypothetical protein S40288_04922 [Stachybotrys chartarum IBT 40288]